MEFLILEGRYPGKTKQALEIPKDQLQCHDFEIPVALGNIARYFMVELVDVEEEIHQLPLSRCELPFMTTVSSFSPQKAYGEHVLSLPKEESVVGFFAVGEQGCVV